MQTVTTAGTTKRQEPAHTAADVAFLLETDRAAGRSTAEIAQDWRIDENRLTDYFAAVDAVLDDANKNAFGEDPLITE